MIPRQTHPDALLLTVVICMKNGNSRLTDHGEMMYKLAARRCCTEYDAEAGLSAAAAARRHVRSTCIPSRDRKDHDRVIVLSSEEMALMAFHRACLLLHGMLRARGLPSQESPHSTRTAAYLAAFPRWPCRMGSCAGWRVPCHCSRPSSVQYLERGRLGSPCGSSKGTVAGEFLHVKSIPLS
jgi:hypothetical protein